MWLQLFAGVRTVFAVFAQYSRSIRAVFARIRAHSRAFSRAFTLNHTVTPSVSVLVSAAPSDSSGRAFKSYTSALSFSHILYYHHIPRNRSHSRSVWLYIQQAPSSRENPRHRCKSTCHCSRFSCPAGACIDWYVAIGHDIFSNPWCRIHSYNHMSVVCVI